jgi:hypothetical protein
VRLEEAMETLYNIPAAGKKKNLLTIESIDRFGAIVMPLRSVTD